MPDVGKKTKSAAKGGAATNVRETKCNRLRDNVRGLWDLVAEGGVPGSRNRNHI
jgi:hypothetical protein